MSKRNLRARRAAKKLTGKSKKKKTIVEVKPWIGVPIQKLDLERQVVNEFESFDEAIEKEELNSPNLINALKKGSKYKGFYWKIV